MIRARQLTKRVEILASTIIPDGVGGNLVTSAVVTTRWCKIEDVGTNSYQDSAGITDFTDTQKFTFRYDANFTINPKIHTFRYGNSEYAILDVKTKGFRHVEQVCIAKVVFGLDTSEAVTDNFIFEDANNFIFEDGNNFVLE